MEWLFALLAILAAGLIGYVAAWLRVDLDLRPRSVALRGAAISGICAFVWLLKGGDGAILVLFAAFGPLVWIDWKRKRLPDPITLPLIFAGVLLAVGGDRVLDAALGASLGYAAFRAFGLLWETLRGVDALGQGDAKLFAAIGAFMGWAVLPEVAFIAALLGIALGAARKMLTGDEEIPFGPALAAGTLAVWAGGPFLSV